MKQKNHNHTGKIRKGDQVIIITGKDKGKIGEVLCVLPKQCKVTVKDANLVKKHTKSSQQSNGGIITKEMPIHISNVSHFDSNTKKPVKIGFKIIDNEKKRIIKKTEEVL